MQILSGRWELFTEGEITDSRRQCLSTDFHMLLIFDVKQPKIVRITTNKDINEDISKSATLTKFYIINLLMQKVYAPFARGTNHIKRALRTRPTNADLTLSLKPFVLKKLLTATARSFPVTARNSCLKESISDEDRRARTSMRDFRPVEVD